MHGRWPSEVSIFTCNDDFFRWYIGVGNGGSRYVEGVAVGDVINRLLVIQMWACLGGEARKRPQRSLLNVYMRVRRTDQAATFITLDSGAIWHSIPTCLPHNR